METTEAAFSATATASVPVLAGGDVARFFQIDLL